MSLVECAKRNKKEFKKSPKHSVFTYLFILFYFILLSILGFTIKFSSILF
jgi:hypothetical protein